VASIESFAVLPAITSFTPASGNPGTRVNIVGTGLGGVTAVAFGGGAAATFTIISPTQIEAVVPQQAVTGPITVTTPDGSAASATVFLVGANADLRLVQIRPADPVLQNQTVTYTLTVSNRGPSTATSVILSNTTSPMLLFQSATLSRGSFTRTGQTVRADIGNLASGASAELILNLSAASPGTATNSATVTAREPDPNPQDNTSVATTVILPNTAILAAERISPDAIRISWPVTATNFVLQSTESLAPPRHWTAVQVTPGIVGDRRVVTVPVSTGRRYYRLILN
jgi:uncharacterized repeat protein (TIGR01451 family)